MLIMVRRHQATQQNIHSICHPANISQSIRPWFLKIKYLYNFLYEMILNTSYLNFCFLHWGTATLNSWVICQVGIISSSFLTRRKNVNSKIYQKAFWLHNNLCESTAQEHNFKRWFCTQKFDWNIRFRDFWYTEINPTQIWYDKFNS